MSNNMNDKQYTISWCNPVKFYKQNQMKKEEMSLEQFVLLSGLSIPHLEKDEAFIQDYCDSNSIECENLQEACHSYTMAEKLHKEKRLMIKKQAASVKNENGGMEMCPAEFGMKIDIKMEQVDKDDNFTNKFIQQVVSERNNWEEAVYHYSIAATANQEKGNLLKYHAQSKDFRS